MKYVLHSSLCSLAVSIPLGSEKQDPDVLRPVAVDFGGEEPEPHSLEIIADSRSSDEEDKAVRTSKDDHNVTSTLEMTSGELHLLLTSQKNHRDATDLKRGNQADKDLDMRPSRHEPDLSDEDIATRLDRYHTEPSFAVPKVNIEIRTDDASKLAPGYYFYGPYEAGAAAPYIFDADGHIVYWGINEIYEERVKNIMPCDYLGSVKMHLCWSEAFHDKAYGHEYVNNHIFDNTYTAVGRSYRAVDGWHSPNSHEYNMLPGGESFLQAVYQFKEADLTPYGGPLNGWIHDGCFQEIDVKTGHAMFSWCATDYIDLDETYMYLDVPGQTNFTEGIGGIGTYKRSWDFIHLNAIDKFPDGNYLVCSRHFNSVFKVAGPDSANPGKVLWRLGGKHNDFKYLNDFVFSRQHHARVLSCEDNATTISLFNNNFNVRNSRALEGLSSNGMIIRLDESALTAEMQHIYTHPYHDRGWRESVTIAEGSLQVLPSGNTVVDWGSLPDITEFAQDGEVLFHASVADHHGRSYRAFKSEWLGRPHWGPKMLVYSHSCIVDAVSGISLVIRMSWNGATEVRAWQLYTSSKSQDGPWTAAGTYNKTGFETEVDLSEISGRLDATVSPYVHAVALDAAGLAIGNVTAMTFVPAADNADCDARGCRVHATAYDESLNTAASCFRASQVPTQRTSPLPNILVLLLLITCIECTCRAYSAVARRLWTADQQRISTGHIGQSSRTRPDIKRLRSGPHPDWAAAEMRMIRASGVNV